MTKFNKSNFYYINEEIEHFTYTFSGPMGDKGKRGKEGEIGEFGIEGQKGDKGPKGDKGQIGERGPLGPQGVKGNEGERGYVGKLGVRGENGNRGNRGITGPPGIRGPPGPKGEMGPIGPRGDRGEVGDKGKDGEVGYDGEMMINYAHSKTFDFIDWKTYADKKWGFKCPNGYVVTSMKTNCRCGNYNRDLTTSEAVNYAMLDPGGKEYLTDSQIDQAGFNDMQGACGRLANKYVKRDCLHSFTCHKLDTYDFPEKVNLLDSRVFPEGKGGLKEERFINKLWVILKPEGLKKTVYDYPEGFFNTEIDFNITENDKFNVNILDKGKYGKQIPYAQECKTKYCDKIGQLCVDKKVCKNEINTDTNCLVPPCWHDQPPTVGECFGSCKGPENNENQFLGQYCSAKKICDLRRNDDCDDPPCWNDIDVLKKCPGRRCPTEGQQCTVDFPSYNRTGYICKNKDHKEPDWDPNSWCRDPPCWHPAEKTVDYPEKCPVGDAKCEIVGQKCLENGTLRKICLNKVNEDNGCLKGPCWHNILPDVECSDLLKTGIVSTGSQSDPNCEREIFKGPDGEEMKDSNGAPLYTVGKCNYEGNCSNIGQRCKINGEVYYECMDSFKKTDEVLPEFNRLKCTRKPCWIPTKVGQDGNPYYDMIVSQYDRDTFKNDRTLSLLSSIKSDSIKGVTYQFQPVDREGEITFDKLYKFMNLNWFIFEANSIEDNLKIIWKMFTGNDNKSGVMNYSQFSAMMKKLNVEAFKYREGKGRIYPKFMPFNEIDAVNNYFQFIPPKEEK